MPAKQEKFLPRTAFACAVTSSQLFGVGAMIMTGIWLSKYQGGFAWDGSTKQFNYHPLFMVIGLVFLNAEAMISYRVFRYESKVVVKTVHLCLQTASFIFVVVSLLAVFSHHDHKGEENITSLHSWIGMIIVVVFGLQLAFGFIVFVLSGVAESTKEAFLRLHKFFGVSIFVASVAQCCIGITQNIDDSKIEPLGTEAMIANFLGLVLIVFCFTVLAVLVPDEFRRLTDKERAIVMLERYDSE
ncbi:cytochrome b561-like [Dendronephthya gigantea]|uniref:cytochrome b561-like n=1 Tax=Dendronephthya gigantea TaxID=151771 RepID=UPI00106998F5|nr:cytochrome b561-like [Dendronephthya gigantea]